MIGDSPDGGSYAVAVTRPPGPDAARRLRAEVRGAVRSYALGAGAPTATATATASLVVEDWVGASTGVTVVALTDSTLAAYLRLAGRTR